MREHKYRAWDKNLEFMIDPAFLSLDGNGLIAVFYENCDDEESLWVTDPIILENIELLEYTGLKDKSGTEIYEGDIVKYPHDPHSCIVQWQELGAVGWSLKPTGGDTAWTQYGMNSHDELEVIGNIYENPELLK